MLLLSSIPNPPAHAHQDTMLHITPDGSLAGLPPQWRATRLHVDKAANGDILRLVISGRDFRRSFKPCVLRKLRRIRHVAVSGSWYHDLSSLPPYLHIDVSTETPGSDQHSFIPQHSITLSLTYGRILGAYEHTRSWLGFGRTRRLRDAQSCTAWR